MFGSLLFASTLDADTGPILLPLGVDGLARIAAEKPAPVGLAALGFLVGGVWVASSGQTTVAERVTWAAVPSFLVSEVAQTVAGRPGALARGYFGYAPATKVLLSSALSTSGTYTGGYQTGAPAADSWVFAMVIGQGASIRNVQVTMGHPSADELVIAQATEKGGLWVPQSSLTYHRQAAPTPC